MVARRVSHVVNVKSGQPRRERLQMQRVVDETEVRLDFRVAAVVPINQGRTVQLSEKKLEVALNRDFLERLPVFAAELEAALFGFRQDFPQRVIDVLKESFLPGFAPLAGLRRKVSRIWANGPQPRSSMAQSFPV